MSEISNLFVSIGLDMKEFEKGITGFQNKMKTVGKNIGDVGKTMSKNITAPVLAAAGAAFGLANQYASMGDDIAKTAVKLGISTDALQEMEYWAGQNGVSASSMERAVGRLNQRIGLAADGSDKYAGALNNLGVEIFEASGKIRSTEDVMYDTIAALRNIEDSSVQSAMAADLFGTKMARDLMPALQDGSLSLEEATKKIHEMGGVMSKEATEAAEQYQDSMDDLKRSFSGVFMELANNFIPIINDDLLPAIQEHVIPAIREFAERISKLVDWFMDLNPETQKMIGIAVGLAAALGPVLMIVGPLITGIAALVSPVGLVVVAIAAAIAIGVLLWRNWDTIKDKAAKLVKSIKKEWDIFKADTLQTWEDISSAVSSTWSKITGTLSDFLEGTKKIFKEGISSIVEWFTGLPGRVLSGLREFRDDVLGIFGGLFDRLVGRSIIPDMMENIEGIIEDGMNETQVIIKKGTDAWEKLFGEGAQKAVAAAATGMGALLTALGGDPGRIAYGRYISRKGGTAGAATFAQFGDALNKAARDIAEAEGVTLSVGRSMAQARISEGQTHLIGSFDSGGIVPGPRGAPRLIMAHGGETLIPTHKPGYQTVPEVTINIYDATDPEKVGRIVERKVVDVIRGEVLEGAR